MKYVLELHYRKRHTFLYKTASNTSPALADSFTLPLGFATTRRCTVVFILLSGCWCVRCYLLTTRFLKMFDDIGQTIYIEQYEQWKTPDKICCSSTPYWLTDIGTHGFSCRPIAETSDSQSPARKFLIYTGHLVLFGFWNVGGYNDLGMWVEWKVKCMHTECLWGNLTENAHLEDRENDGIITLGGSL